MTSQPFDDAVLEAERYELREPPRYRFEADRREFMQTLGAGLIVAVAAGNASAQRRGGRTARRNEQLAQRFHLGNDGVVTVLTSKVEAGQGSRTQITQAAAEELRMPMDRIRLIMADTSQCPDDGGTAGSRTTPATVPRVRNAAAALRNLLEEAAAERLGAKRSELKSDAGVWSAGEKRLTLAELAADNAFIAKLKAVTPDSGIELIPIAKQQVLGKPAPKVGGADVVRGAAQYPSDIIRPGMLYGKVLRPELIGAKLQSVEIDTARAMDGVHVVREGEFVGCAAQSSWLAGKAIDAIAKSAKWDVPSTISNGQKLYAHLKQTAKNDGGRRGSRVSKEIEKEHASSSQAINVEYTVAYIQHAPMESRVAVAEWNEGRLTVWTGTQQPSRVHGELCAAFRLGDDQVRVIVPDMGGGFGGKHTGEAAVEAARLAKSAGKPVHLQWSREEEFTSAYFRPAGVIDVRAGIDAAGAITAWEFTNYNSGGSAIESPYRAAANRVQFFGSDAPLRQGSYRALASTANTFARESAMDELAKLAKIDPLEFRLRNLEEGRLKNVLRAAAEKFGWDRRRSERAANRGIGLACGTEKGSFVAACVEVEVVEKSIRVRHVCQAYECGAIQNPANLRSQVEGGLIMGLGGALSEEIVLKDGKIANASFSSYHVPRMKDVPELDIVLVDRPDLPSVGAGETPIIAVAPAIANAVEFATGKRCRSMPLRVS